MDTSYKNNWLKTLCRQRKEAEKALGKPCAKKLRNRLDDIDSASNVGELVAGRPHPLKGDKAGMFSLDLGGGMRLVFKPTDDCPPMTDEGTINWLQVETITIVFIGDYHD